MAHGDPRLLLAPDPTLLVIEDTTEHAILVRVAARRAFPGLDVRVAGGGREGIAYLAGSAPFQDRSFHAFPDLVILDLLMPDIDGFGVLEWIREHEMLRPVPVVILTVSTKAEHEQRAVALGAEAVYIKPGDLDELGDLVKEIVRKWMPVPVTSWVSAGSVIPFAEDRE